MGVSGAVGRAKGGGGKRRGTGKPAWILGQEESGQALGGGPVSPVPPAGVLVREQLCPGPPSYLIPKPPSIRASGLQPITPQPRAGPGQPESSLDTPDYAALSPRGRHAILPCAGPKSSLCS